MWHNFFQIRAKIVTQICQRRATSVTIWLVNTFRWSQKTAGGWFLLSSCKLVKIKLSCNASTALPDWLGSISITIMRTQIDKNNRGVQNPSIARVKFHFEFWIFLPLFNQSTPRLFRHIGQWHFFAVPVNFLVTSLVKSIVASSHLQWLIWFYSPAYWLTDPPPSLEEK